MRDSTPKWIPPMLAKLSGSLPKDEERWAYEMKWDGIRGLALVESGKLRILTRNQIEVTTRYPELVGLGAAPAGHNVILDGEIVGFDEQGGPRFEALQQRMGLEGGHRIQARPDVSIAYIDLRRAPPGRNLAAERSLRRAARATGSPSRMRKNGW
jgi:ATP-dependent DNA ligase